MKFAEVPIDLIKEMFSKTPVVTHLNEIRADFEEFNKGMFVDKMDTKANSISNLQYYKTELFRSYCMGVLSVLSKESKLNKRISNEINQKQTTT